VTVQRCNEKADRSWIGVRREKRAKVSPGIAQTFLQATEKRKSVSDQKETRLPQMDFKTDVKHMGGPTGCAPCGIIKGGALHHTGGAPKGLKGKGYVVSNLHPMTVKWGKTWGRLTN